jgi:Flp pilus assembly protein TadG
MLGQEGETLVEIALSYAILFTLLLGTIQISLALYSYHFASYAARQATRYASVRGSSCTLLTNCNITSGQIQSYVRGFAFSGINSNNIAITTTWLKASTNQPTTWSACANQCNAPGNQVQVLVTYAFPLGIPFTPWSTVNISSTSQMVIAN